MRAFSEKNRFLEYAKFGRYLAEEKVSIFSGHES